MALAGGNSNRNAMKLKIGQHDRESSKAKCNLQVPLPTVHHTPRERGILKKSTTKCAHAQLFVCHFPSCSTSSVHLFGIPHTSPSAFVFWLASRRGLQQLFLSSSCQEFNFFSPNITKLVGISCLRVPPYGDMLKKIKKLALSRARGTFLGPMIVVWKRLFIKT